MSRELTSAADPEDASIMAVKCISKLAFELRSLKARDKATAAYWGEREKFYQQMENDLMEQQDHVQQLEDACADGQVIIEAMEKELGALRAEKALKNTRRPCDARGPSRTL